MNPQIEANLRAFETDVNAERTIRDAITGAYKNLKPELELINKYETQQFPSFYGEFSGYGAGTGASDLSPTTQLQNAWGEAAGKSASARTARGIFDVRQAGMEDLIKSALGQWGQGYQGAQNQFDRWLALQQLARSGPRAPENPVWPGGDQPQNQGPQMGQAGLIYDTDTGKVVGWTDGYSSRELPGQGNAAVPGAPGMSTGRPSAPMSSGYQLPVNEPANFNAAADWLRNINLPF